MGAFETFLARGGASILMHCIVPGSGFIIDAWNLYDTLSTASDLGDLASSIPDMLQELQDMKDEGKEIVVETADGEVKTLVVSKQRCCSICHKPGHNKRTCHKH